MASECLPTKGNIWNRIHKGDFLCTLCGEEEETYVHLFTKCFVSRAVAFASPYGFRLDSINVTTSVDLVLWCLKIPCLEELNLPLIMVCFLYSIWTMRNDKLFGDKLNVALVVKKWTESVEELSNVLVEKVLSKSRDRGSLRWLPPKENQLAINVDAAWTDGWGAAAMVVRDCWGKASLVASSLFQVNAAAHAELKALIWAISIALEREWFNVDWRSDSRVVVGQANSSAEPLGWNTRNYYLILHQTAPEAKLDSLLGSTGS